VDRRGSRRGHAEAPHPSGRGRRLRRAPRHRPRVAAVGLLGPLDDAPHRARPAPALNQVSVRGHPARWREARSGRPVLLIHRAGRSGELWGQQRAGLGDGARLLAVDLPGHGGTAGPALLSVEAYAEWIVTFLETVAIDRAVLVGHSMGGAIAL